MVGGFQIAFGVLRLGGVVDYISQPVVLGYVVGAVLIGVGRCPTPQAFRRPSGNLLERLLDWWTQRLSLDVFTVGLAVGTIVFILASRRFSRKFPAGLVAVAIATGVSWGLGLHARGVATISDLAVVPTDILAVSAPNIGMLGTLLPYAIACTVLSSVESAAVGRSIASSTGQQLDANTEFFGQGAANIAASF